MQTTIGMRRWLGIKWSRQTESVWARTESVRWHQCASCATETGFLLLFVAIECNLISSESLSQRLTHTIPAYFSYFVQRLHDCKWFIGDAAIAHDSDHDDHEYRDDNTEMKVNDFICNEANYQKFFRGELEFVTIFLSFRTIQNSPIRFYWGCARECECERFYCSGDGFFLFLFVVRLFIIIGPRVTYT